MNFSKLKLLVSNKKITQLQIASELDVTNQRVSIMFKTGILSIAQLEIICAMVGIHPGELFDDFEGVHKKYNVSSPDMLINALEDKFKLQKEVNELLREQLNECKSKLDTVAIPK